MRRARAVAGLAAGALLAATGSAAATTLPARPAEVVRVSVDLDGAEVVDGGADTFNNVVAITPDGRYVAFPSSAPGLVSGDTNSVRDVFVRDMATGVVERVSVSSAGVGGNSQSTAPALSADGRYVAFASFASNLVPGDRNGAWDVFVHDRVARTTERVSVGPGGREGDAWSRFPSLSADGRYVAFDSGAETLADDGNGMYDVFVHDRATGATTLVSRAPDGEPGNGVSYSPSLSADGSQVAFYSNATNLSAADGNGSRSDVFVADLATGAVDLVSVGASGDPGNAISYAPSLSADGSVVAFVSRASNLVPADTNGALDVFVRDRAAGRTERVSLSSAGEEHDDAFPRPDHPYDDVTLPGVQPRPRISADGRHVTFLTRAPNLLPAVPTGVVQAVVHDRLTGTTAPVSLAEFGHGADADVMSPALSGDGGRVVFASPAGNLVADDSNAAVDVFVAERGGPRSTYGLRAQRDADRIHVSGAAGFAGTVAQATDPAGDAPVPPADLTGVDVAIRPELGDLLVRWRVAGLPAAGGTVVPATAASDDGRLASRALPATTYRLDFTVDGVRHLVTVDSTSRQLQRCTPQCAAVADLRGGYGHGGNVITAAVPLGASAGGAALDTVTAHAAIGPHVLDSLAVGAVDVPGRTYAVGLAPPGTPADEVAFQAVPVAPDGRFGASLPAAPGPQTVFARSCLGAECAVAQRDVP